MVRTINLPADWSQQHLGKGRARGRNGRWGKAAGMQDEKPAPKSRVMLDTFTIGFEPPGKNGDVGRLCRNPSTGRRLICQRSCITQRVSVWVPGCCSGSLSLQNEHCSAIDFIWSSVHHPGTSP